MNWKSKEFIDIKNNDCSVIDFVPYNIFKINFNFMGFKVQL